LVSRRYIILHRIDGEQALYADVLYATTVTDFMYKTKLKTNDLCNGNYVQHATNIIKTTRFRSLNSQIFLMRFE